LFELFILIIHNFRNNRPEIFKLLVDLDDNEDDEEEVQFYEERREPITIFDESDTDARDIKVIDLGVASEDIGGKRDLFTLYIQL